MRSTYKTLFTIAIRNSYYENGNGGRDFDFIIPAETAQLMRNGKLLSRVVDGTLTILCEADAAGTPRIPIAGATLKIGLKLTNPYFHNFTDVPMAGGLIGLLKSADGPNFPITNATKQAHLVGKRFSHSPVTAQRPVTITLRDAAGNVVQEDTLAPKDNIPASEVASYDLKDRGLGTYTASESLPAVNPASTIYVSHPELAQAGMFGILEIAVDEAMYAAKQEFTISFSARTEKQRYFVVSNTADATNLRVADSRANPRVEFGPKVDQIPDELKTTIATLTKPGKAVTLFTTAALARRERGLQKIQLVKGADVASAEVLIANLPQPSAASANSDIFIYL